MNDKEYLYELALIFEYAETHGVEEDTPEGSKYIRISVSLAQEIAVVLRRVANRLPEVQ